MLAGHTIAFSALRALGLTGSLMLAALVFIVSAVPMGINTVRGVALDVCANPLTKYLIRLNSLPHTLE